MAIQWKELDENEINAKKKKRENQKTFPSQLYCPQMESHFIHLSPS
jgi:hypothetical protein